jgi:hypothetical protein
LKHKPCILWQVSVVSISDCDKSFVDLKDCFTYMEWSLYGLKHVRGQTRLVSFWY